MAEWVDAISLARGGFIELPCWREEIGVVPTYATLTVPGVIDTPQPASIMRDGTVRAFINFKQAQALGVGSFSALWSLRLPVDGNDFNDPSELLQDLAPPVIEMQTDTGFQVVDPNSDPTNLLAPDRGYMDAFGLPTVRYLRKKGLFGMPGMDFNLRLMGDAVYQRAINAAIKRIERELDIQLAPRIFNGIQGYTVNPSDMGLTDPSQLPPIQDESGYDYDPQRFRTAFSFLRLRHRPVAQVLSLQLWVGPNVVATVPNNWIFLNKMAGDIQLVPDALNTLALGLGGVAFPMLRGAYGGQPVPHLWRVAYVTGLSGINGPGESLIPDDVFEVISWIATQNLLLIIGDAQIAGVASQSVSVDGISESVSLTASAENGIYGAYVSELEKRIKKWFEASGPTYQNIRIGMV